MLEIKTISRFCGYSINWNNLRKNAICISSFLTKCKEILNSCIYFHCYFWTGGDSNCCWIILVSWWLLALNCLNPQEWLHFPKQKSDSAIAPTCLCQPSLKQVKVTSYDRGHHKMLQWWCSLCVCFHCEWLACSTQTRYMLGAHEFLMNDRKHRLAHMLYNLLPLLLFFHHT